MAPRLPEHVRLAKRNHDAAFAGWRRHKQHCPTCKQAQADELPSNMCSTGYELFRDEHLTDQAERNARIQAARPATAPAGLW